MKKRVKKGNQQMVDLFEVLKVQRKVVLSTLDMVGYASRFEKQIGVKLGYEEKSKDVYKVWLDGNVG